MIEYFTHGSMDEPEGLTLATRLVDDETGKVLIECTDVAGGYKAKKIDKEEYEEILSKMNDSSSSTTIGLVNEKGLKSWNDAIEKLVNVSREERKVDLENIYNIVKAMLADGRIKDSEAEGTIKFMYNVKIKEDVDYILDKLGINHKGSGITGKTR